MDITLVTTTFNDEVHGTDNDKRTGCGISLIKAENVTRFRRGNKMTDLKEITCDKCKYALTKKIIRADKKEMRELLKEERMRSKKGIEDETIVPLGNTVAKITKSPEQREREEQDKRASAEAAAAAKREAEEAAREAEEAARREAEEAARLEAEKAAQAAAVQKTIPGTGVAMDNDLAAFAIEVPKEEEEPAPAQDDFLAQFAIQKPEAEEPDAPAMQAPAQDDFLAQFAIPTPGAPKPPVQVFPAGGYNNANGEMTDIGADEPDEAPAYNSTPNIDIKSEEDIMKMFSVGQPNVSQETSAYENTADIIDVAENELTAAEAYQEKVQEAEEENVEVDVNGNSDWDRVANQIFGYGGAPASAEMDELPGLDNAPAQAPAAPPVLDDISVPQPAAPVLDDLSAYQQNTAPVLDDISVPGGYGAAAYASEQDIEDLSDEEDYEEQYDEYDESDEDEDTSGDSSEQLISTISDEDISADSTSEATEIDEENDMNKYRYSTPIFADEMKPQQLVQPQPAPQAKPAAPAAMAAPEQLQVITVPQFMGYDVNGQPVYQNVQMHMTGRDANGMPVFTPVANQGGIPMPSAIPPVQPEQPQMQQPVQPVQQAAAPQVQRPVQPVQQAAAPQVQRPAQPAQQAAAPQVQRPAQPAQQAAAPQAQQNSGAYVPPTANISKIAVNPHKSTSQAFINAIASSKNYADKNLIETQGLKQNAAFFDSVEDVLSQMGDSSAKQKLQQQQAAAKKNVPVYEEYKGPGRAAASRSSYSSSSSSKSDSSNDDDMRFMTKSELKAKKKQDKIDAKFKKDMAKRGL